MKGSQYRKENKEISPIRKQGERRANRTRRETEDGLTDVRWVIQMEDR